MVACRNEQERNTSLVACGNARQEDGVGWTGSTGRVQNSKDPRNSAILSRWRWWVMRLEERNNVELESSMTWNDSTQDSWSVLD